MGGNTTFQTQKDLCNMFYSPFCKFSNDSQKVVNKNGTT